MQHLKNQRRHPVFATAASLLTILAVSNAPGAWAGDCVYDETGCLETGLYRDGSRCDLDSALECMSCERQVIRDSRLWAGPTTAQRFRSQRESPAKARLTVALMPLLNARQESLAARRRAYHAARVLACYGIGRLGDHDIFEIITSVERPPLAALASLDDSRTVDFLPPGRNARSRISSQSARRVSR